MTGSRLMLIVDGTDAAAFGESVVDEIYSPLPDAARPQTHILAAGDALGGGLDRQPCDAAWLMLRDDPRGSREFAVLTALGERHIPTALSSASKPALNERGLLLQAGEMIEPGVVNLPAETQPAVARAVLATLLASAPLVQGLCGDVRVLSAQSTGMAGQFDKIDQEMRMAVKIQREFLPKSMPRGEGYGVDVLWRPASYVSGDIYDVMRLDEHHIGLFIADAVGHGTPAALMTIYIKQAIKTRQITPGIGPGYRVVPPGETLAGLNRAMIAQDAGSASLGTAAYAVLDTRTQRLTLARAGHPAPVLLRGAGTTEWLEPDGAMLGVFPEEVFEELVIDLEDDDRLLIYSDGFEVAFPGCEGQGRLANVHYATEFEDLRAGSGEQALDLLQSRLDLQSGSLNQRDDLTVICATVKVSEAAIEARAHADRAAARAVA